MAREEVSTIRIDNLEKRLTELEEATKATKKTETWVKYRVIELLKSAGLYIERTE